MLTELLNRIDSYLLLHCTLRDLEAWLLSNLQRILDSGEEAAIELANEVDADFVQLGEGLIDELTFRERLQGYAGIRSTVSATASAKPVTAKWAPMALPQQQHSEWTYADIKLGMAS